MKLITNYLESFLRSKASMAVKSQYALLDKGMVRSLAIMVFFVPALLLVMVGVAFLYMPDAVVLLMAALFLFLGVVAAYIGWRLMLLKRRIDTIFRDFKGKVVIQTSSRGGEKRPTSRSSFETLSRDDMELFEGVKGSGLASEGKKKIVLH